MRKIAIFASGSGTNAQEIILHAQQKNSHYQVAVVVADNPRAGVLSRAKKLQIESVVWQRDFLKTTDAIKELQNRNIELIVLAGYLGLIPRSLLDAFPQRILNIHPALLPLYGGKGMYGDRVHQAVLAAGDTLSGITIHIIDQEYDRGTMLCQATCPVFPHDTPESLAQRIHRLEHRYYPIAIDEFASRPL